MDAGLSRVFATTMKHPGDKISNDVWCNLPEAALKIALSNPKKRQDSPLSQPDYQRRLHAARMFRTMKTASADPSRHFL